MLSNITLTLAFAALAASTPVSSKRDCGTLPYGVSPASAFRLRATVVGEPNGTFLSLSGIVPGGSETPTLISYSTDTSEDSRAAFYLDEQGSLSTLVDSATGVEFFYSLPLVTPREYVAFSADAANQDNQLYALVTDKCTPQSQLWIMSVDNLSDPELVDPWLLCTTGGDSTVAYGYGVLNVPVGCTRVRLAIVGIEAE